MTAKPGTTSTADRILDAAIGLMNTKGYNPVSVREIAKAVGLSEMTVFRHFPSKYAMLMAAMRRAPYAEMIEDVFTTHVRWELEHDLRHFMRRYMDIAEQRIGIWRIYFSAIGQIRVGQDVAFTIDGYPGRTFSGRIYEINPAACSVFSLISTENVAGYFTKIMQRVPVKISLPRLDSPETDPGEPEVVFRIGMQGTIEIQL